MPGNVKIKIVSARNLPIMDRSTFLTDAFVEIRLGNECYKTDVVKRTLNPQWNTDWILFELDDQQLQEESLQIRVLDHDTYSAHDSIGRVYIDMNTLLVRRKKRSLSGWFPIYDTMHGIRGELNLALRIDLFSDVSKFRQSSIGVKFFYSSCIPSGFSVTRLLGFVEELIMMDDPEHQWIEKLRTSRASNETRQRLFSKLSGELQRKMGVKVLEMGGNSIIGFQLRFDFEGETGVVGRGIGTVAELSEVELADSSSSPTTPSNLLEGKFNINSKDNDSIELEAIDITNRKYLPSPVINEKTEFYFGEFPFLTISLPPAGLIRTFGSVVSVKSVKLLEKGQNDDHQECRDSWWFELRTEIASHMRQMKCDAVLGYNEDCIIHEDICILIGSGTAVCLDSKIFRNNRIFQMANNIKTDCSDSKKPDTKGLKAKLHQPPSLDITAAKTYGLSESKKALIHPGCKMCHMPENIENFIGTTTLCHLCNKSPVPEVIFSTSEIPEDMNVLGLPSLIQARVCRTKKENKGEACAKEINDILPFLEYDMHYRLVQNLTMKGMNGLFGLKISLCLGENVIVAIGTGTGVFLPALPSPIIPRSKTLMSEEDRVIKDWITFRTKCIDYFNIQQESETAVDREETFSDIVSKHNNSNYHAMKTFSDMSKRSTVSEETFFDTGELNTDYINSVIREGLPPTGFIMETVNFSKSFSPTDSNRFIIRFARTSSLFNICESGNLGSFYSERIDEFMNEFNSSLWLRLRRFMPCIMTGINYTFNVTEEDGFEAMITGYMTVNKESQKLNDFGRSADSSLSHQTTEKISAEFQKDKTSEGSDKNLSRFFISPLPTINGFNIDTYLGSLNFFLVRETTSLREYGGVGGFIQACVGEVQAVVASHAIAAGGNAIVSCHMNEVILNYPTNTRQMNTAQCLINIYGDIVIGHCDK